MESCEKLYYLARGLSDIEKARLDHVLQLLLERISDLEALPAERSRFLADVEKYFLRKKPKIASVAQNEIDYLRYVRNAFAHREYIPDEAVRVAIPMFWRVIRNIADDWQGPELFNLLSYSLKHGEIHLFEGGSTKTVIRRFEDSLNRLPEEEQLVCFRNLLLSIYDTEYFHKYTKLGRSRNMRR
ncbi:hypothetical protein A1353_21615 [Methylomonas methanica]|uniref:Uncharacterized protein n=1 Tax=Methylomonas methanica TaxID=421 RepID=A0A177M0T0_METMH|nr:hypothetical protein [Methylomonas methanica]OAH98974.1 hypothetical protein A1353_21615 [Methylomonas methanica]